MSNEKISVIVPLYNSETTVNRCLDSIISQNYDNIEVILINDGSTDKTHEICIDYKDKYSNIKYISKKNEGPSIARQRGIEICEGDYISFIDSDDYIDQGLYKKANELLNSNYDVVEFGYREVGGDNSTIKELILEEDFLRNNVIQENYAINLNTTNFLCNKIFKKELFYDITYPKLYAGEDSCILTQIFFKARTHYIIKDIYYNYVMTEDSLTRSSFNIKKLDNIKAGEFMFNFYNENYESLKGYSAFHICSYAAKLIFESRGYDEEEKFYTYLRDKFSDYYQETKNSYVREKISKKRMVFVDLFNFSEKLAELVYKKFNRG